MRASGHSGGGSPYTRARQDLDSIWTFTVERWGAAVAEAYIRDLNAAFERVGNNSEIGADVSFVRSGYRRVPVRSHTVYYRKDAHYIAVIRILHQSQDVDRQLP